MEIISVSPIELCAVNFKKLDELNRRTSNMLASLMLARVRFLQNRSVIMRKGKIWIAKSREELANWYGVGLRKVDALLALLVKKGLLEKSVSTLLGKKKLFLRAKDEHLEMPVNFSLLDALLYFTKDLDSALCLSKIAFSSNQSHIQHKGLQWASHSRKDLSQFLKVSIRKIDYIIEDLKRKGLILQENFMRNGKLISHFHVPQSTLRVIKQHFQDYSKSSGDLSKNSAISSESSESNASNCKTTLAKRAGSIKRTLSKEEEKIKQTLPDGDDKAAGESTIRFAFSDLESRNISSREQNYLRNAFRNTIQHPVLAKMPNHQKAIIWEQIKFSIMQQSLKRTFKHAVARSLKILREGRWKIPFGFEKYNETGKQQALHLKTQMTIHEIYKSEMRESKQEGRGLLEKWHNLGNLQEDTSTVSLTTKQALKIATQLKLLENLSSTSKDDQKAKDVLIDQHFQNLKLLFQKGADKAEVRAFLSRRI